MIDLTPLFNALIAAASVAISVFFIPWLRSKTTAQQQSDLLRWADVAVAAAQQLYHQCSGQTRLDYALSLLAEQGFNVDLRQVRDAVEAAVLKLHAATEGAK
ncbi:MAG: holin [Oscillospiraceae bacterium]|nr:holin [Oscillospiraceae bacterium]